MNERIEKLRQESLDTQPYISIERASLVTEAYKSYDGTVSISVLRALAFKHVLENKSTCISEGELIVGERGGAPPGGSYLSGIMLPYSGRPRND